jgi:hypothetical protein
VPPSLKLSPGLVVGRLDLLGQVVNLLFEGDEIRSAFELVLHLRRQLLPELRVALHGHPAEALEMVLSERLIQEAVLPVYAPFSHVECLEYLGTCLSGKLHQFRVRIAVC